MFVNRTRLSHQQQQQQQQQRHQQLELQRKHAKADRVRKLWVEFEQWLKQPRNDMERERDQLLHQTGRATSAAVKAARRRVEEAHFSKAREEWQRRLRAVDLHESDWDPMNEAEMKAVEEALGVNDPEGYITDPSPSPPHQLVPLSASTSTITSGSLVPAENPANKSVVSLINANSTNSFVPPSVPVAAPPITPVSRTSSSSTSSYECIRPEEFHSEDDDELVVTDSDYSSFSSTISSIITEEEEAVAPVTEYMFTQALESSFTGRPLETLNDKGPVLSRNNPASKLTENGSGGGPPLAPPKRPPDTKLVQPSVAKMNGTGPKNSPSPQTLPASSSASSSKTQSSKSSRIHYPLVTPSLSDLSDYDEVENDAETESTRLSPSLVAQFEDQFEARKLEIRVGKIREFHQLACDADIDLCINIANSRRCRTLSRQEENRLVEEHYKQTVALRERMEKERKEQVKQEQKRLRFEFSQRHSSSSSTSFLGQAQGPLQGRPQVGSQESDTDQEDDMQQRLERMKQEQLALQAKYGSYDQPTEPRVTRRRAGTLTKGTVPPAIHTNSILDDKRSDESDHISTPRPSGSAWSVKPAAGSSKTGPANVLNPNGSRKNIPQFDSVDQESGYDIDGIDHQADNEEDDHEKENSAFWSPLTSSLKKKAPVPSAPSPFNFSLPQKSSQRPLNGKSRLGIVTSAWDDNVNDDETNVVADNANNAAVDKEAEKDVESPQEKTPVIPSAPAPSVSQNKKQSKKQRQANKKGTAPATITTTKTEKAAPAPAPSTQKTQAKMAGVGKKALLTESDDLSSTPRPSVLKKIQAQLANEEGLNEDDDETPTTPRPAAVKRSAMQNNNSWARELGKGAGNSARNNSGFDDDVHDLMDASHSATSSRTTLNQPITDAPPVPGSWKWGAPQNDSARGQVDPSVVNGRKGQTGRTVVMASAAANNAVEPEANKRKGKKAVNGQRGPWGKRATVEMEEVPDDEGDDLFSRPQNESLPYNSRIILEQRDVPEVQQPRILEPKPSKPRAVFENIFQYGETAPDPRMVHDLRGELNDWSDERIVNALARMAQESAEMERRVNDFPAVPMNGNASAGMNGNGAAKAMPIPRPVAEKNMMVPKQVRWQKPPAIAVDTMPAFSNKMMSRGYDDEAFSPMAANNGFQAFNFGSYGTRTNGAAAAGWPSSMNANGQYPLAGNPLIDAEPDDDELARTARSLLENIHISVSSQQRNKPGFAAA